MFRIGDVIFFKKVKVSSRSKDKDEGTFKGHGMGLLLGTVPPFGRDPDIGLVRRLLGAIGYVSFDDVFEFAGEEAGKDIVKKFEVKYTPAEATQTPVLTVLPSEKPDSEGGNDAA